jgi:DNA mismatch repair protein MutL
MSVVKVLPENIINKIAAGEVVERPASVVKELVENSLDAGARAVTVTIKHGGKELIRVTDDGEGMSADDARHSLKRYATSKITSVEDIFRVRSFGFRGEALPSIAAVSRLTLITRKKGATAGTEIGVTGGKVTPARQSGSAGGTTVEARHLFFNTPARKKFLRSDRAEYLAIVGVLTTFALGTPAVHFRLFNDTRKAMDYQSCTSLQERIAQLHDEETVDALIPLRATTQEVSISGFISGPSVSRANRTGQYFFINSRPVKSPALSFALQQGYENTLAPKRHGLAFLFLDIALPRVDVNVHPNKKEVRVADERQVQKLLVDVVCAALHTERTIPLARPSAPKQPGSSVTPMPSATLPHSRRYGKSPTPTFAAREPRDHFYGISSQGGSDHPSFQELPFDKDGKGSVLRILGQYQATYILAEYQGKLFIVDQHAAHERVVYERTLDLLSNNRAPSQRQLIPVTFSLDYREQEVLEEYLPELEHLGFGVNNLGRNTYSLDAAPALLAGENPKQLVLDFIHEMMEWQHSRAVEDKRKAIAAAIACKRKTVKAVTRLVPEAMERLVKDLFQTKEPFQCPHGRPTCITLTPDALEKQFGRR